ncbi:MAG: hypothetical protein RRC07_13220 [Anaerolineae bacterium]|nr:hypothetical protein [Anaerolineae bacterium]
MSETRIISFILRFVQPEQGDTALPRYGVVRHVQSREEVHFTTMGEALAFINRYVTLEDESGAMQPREEA